MLVELSFAHDLREQRHVVIIVSCCYKCLTGAAGYA